jgi:hypothetical protein
MRREAAAPQGLIESQQGLRTVNEIIQLARTKSLPRIHRQPSRRHFGELVHAPGNATLGR